VQIAAYAGITLFTVLMVAGFATSYARNRAYVAEVQDSLKDLPGADTLAGLPDLRSYFARALARLEVISDTQDSAGRYRDHVPLLMRFGLFQGRALYAQAHGAYLRELDGTLLPGELAALARQEWQRLFPDDPAIRKALDKHFTARVEDPQKPRALSLDSG
ncbi:ImcF-related family protein, partial [Paraburkholderia bryophila]|uniref:ImcF-related family protein n=1 Tax=Paraburkholderia bryophila TaxID=420952 RepID=UPI0024463DE0